MATTVVYQVDQHASICQRIPRTYLDFRSCVPACSRIAALRLDTTHSDQLYFRIPNEFPLIISGYLTLYTHSSNMRSQISQALPKSIPTPKTPRQMQHNTISNASTSQPNPPKQHNNRRKKTHPNPPPNPRLLRHPQHPPHRTLEPIPRILKLVVHLLRESG